MRHHAPNPFPYVTPKGKVVVDERCRCGALRSVHADSFGGLAYGHGPCGPTGCPKYTWDSSIMEKPKAPRRRRVEEG